MLWAVMLAVPLQGYAATTMAFCAPTGHAASAAATLHQAPEAAPEAAMHAGHAGHAGHGSDNRHGGIHLGHGDHVQASADAPAADHHANADGGSAHKCGNCGACHSLALTAALPQFVTQTLPPADLAEPFHPVANVAPRLLDKPPRA